MVFLALLSGVALGLGIADREVGVFERSAASEIASLLKGSAKSVTLSAVPDGVIGGLLGVLRLGTIQASHFSTDELPLFTESWRSKQGIVRMLAIQLSDFRLRDLQVESLSVEIPDCRYDLGLLLKEKRIRISRSGTGSGQVRVNERALTAFALRKFPTISALTIRCDRGWIWLEGEGEFLVIQTKFWMRAKLVAKNGSQLVLEQALVNFDGIRAEPDVAQVILDSLNPVVDLNKDLGLHGAMDVTSVRAENGSLIACGSARIPETTLGMQRNR